MPAIEQSLTVRRYVWAAAEEAAAADEVWLGMVRPFSGLQTRDY
jgi:hypothetical protein